MNSYQVPPSCPVPCEHTDAEHRAFDRGVFAGKAGVEPEDCPYDGSLAQDWLTGHSVGWLDVRSAFVWLDWRAAE